MCWFLKILDKESCNKIWREKTYLQNKQFTHNFPEHLVLSMGKVVSLLEARLPTCNLATISFNISLSPLSKRFSTPYMWCIYIYIYNFLLIPQYLPELPSPFPSEYLAHFHIESWRRWWQHEGNSMDIHHLRVLNLRDPQLVKWT